ncbi:L,D-transpeptidase family protein [Flavihumibacter solisilvae]|nr:L,D-transpeptidase family protein [Flavihumibacter solisilvae]
MKIKNLLRNMRNNPLLWKYNRLLICMVSFTMFINLSCGSDQAVKAPADVVIAKSPEEIEEKIEEQLKQSIDFILNNGDKMKDSTVIPHIDALNKVYTSGAYQPLWSDKGNWLPRGDSLFFLVSKAKEFGLFPSDYHLLPLLAIRNKIVTDTVARKNVALWARADLLLSDAYLLMASHLKYGHFDRDSITVSNDSLFNTTKQVDVLKNGIVQGQLRSTLESLEPVHQGYKQIRELLPRFLDTAQFREYTIITFPNPDSTAVYGEVAKRLQEAGLLAADWNPADSATYTKAVKTYQQANGIRTTGVAAELTIKSLNNTDWEKFKRIAITLDRYRQQIPEHMPETFVWVNLPAYQLTVVDTDTVVMQSKIIVGAVKTRTPVLSSEITNFITYPQWTVPYSIIFKEMLPKIQEDITYLEKQNLMVVDKYDSVVNPAEVEWNKVTRNNFPYLIRQRQGDDNSLGLMKFNFRNKYAVYLHDTNARGLFGKKDRALSHGCVRVQEWEKLSRFLVRNDEIRYNPDTIKAWIGRQEKHIISDFARVPIYIRYFTIEAKDDKLRFFDDIYGEDRFLADRYFKSKPIS